MPDSGPKSQEQTFQIAALQDCWAIAEWAIYFKRNDSQEVWTE